MTRAPLESVCRAAGLDRADVVSTRSVGGGCINNALKVRTTRGDFCLKWNAGAGPDFSGVGPDFFRMEAEGLSALAATGTVNVPRVAAMSDPEDEVPWLLLEWIEEARPTRDAWQRLGRGLAELHGWRPRAPRESGGNPAGTNAPAWRDGHYGWHRDNVIGSLPQPNRWMDDWADFWVEMRILPLARELGASGVLSQDRLALVERAAARISGLVGPAAEADGPSLLHGDLWSGNVLFGVRPFVIDPSVYVGHREVDLAMCRLFGGFPAPFYHAYEAALPLQAGYERRRPAYQFYPLLVHARLFGGGYVASVERAAQAVLDTRA